MQSSVVHPVSVGHALPVVSVMVTQVLVVIVEIVVGVGEVVGQDSMLVLYAVPHAPWQTVGHAV